MMLTTRLALGKTLLDVFALHDVYDKPDELQDEVLRLVGDLDEVEATSLVRALADATQMLESDLLRWRAVGDLAVALDLFELIPVLLDGLGRSRDVHQAGNIAALAANPAVQPAQRSAVRTHIEELSAPEATRRMLEIRLGLAEPRSSLEHALAGQMWPGLYERENAHPRVVYVIEQGARSADVWHAIAVLTRAGARVRRISPSVGQRPLADGWLLPSAPLLHWGGEGLAQWRAIGGSPNAVRILVAGKLEGGLERARLINRVRLALPGSQLKSTDDKASLPAAFAPETLDAGAYDAPEMRYLAAATRRGLSRLASEGLTPVQADVQRWSFSQLVAVRLVQGFRASGLKYQRQATDLVKKLDDLASANAEHRVGLGVDGDVYIDSGDGFRNARTNQQAFDSVLAVDDAFRPFVLGAGAVPDLLRPGRFTTVHPLTLGGTPCIEERRISARALALASVGGHATSNILRSAYPELKEGQLADGIAVGTGILAMVAS